MKKISLSLFLLLLFNIVSAADDPVALKQSCNSGVADDCYTLAGIYNFGIGIEKDTAKAAKLFKKACDAGSSKACSVYEKVSQSK